MPDWLFPLPIFPEGSLASSVITTVWVGVFVIAFFNLRFGWVLSGLVVPGYLVPLLIARPISFGVIIVEASVTYFVVWLFSERLAGVRSWSSLFGRDRFVALVFVSIAVRLLFDGWLLPRLADHLQAEYAFALDWQGNLHSFGLIVISLLANQFWKTGYRRGMTQAAVTIGLTYLIVRYGLMELTNFRISGVSYLYEDLASSILASPKAYIILVVTIILASRMNLRYGWDFNGVLIPALIALQWYQPLKVLSSFVEAFVILGLAHVVLRLPIFARMTIEGARKIVLFHNISFAYRMVLGFGLVLFGFEGKVTDFYGFGYLLSTLMAMKMYDKDIAARLSRATLQISLVGVALGSVAGFALTLLPVLRASSAVVVATGPTGPGEVVQTGQTISDFAGQQAVAVLRLWDLPERPAPSPAEYQQFRSAVADLLGGQVDAALPGLAALGYRVERLQGGVIALTDGRARRGGGSFLVNPAAPSDLLISVADPVAVPGMAMAGVALMQATGARALALGGTTDLTESARLVPLEQTYESLFQAFHDASGASVLKLVAAAEGTGAQLEVPFRLPAGLNPDALNPYLGAVETVTGRQGQRTVQEGVAATGYATLSLDAAALSRLVASRTAMPQVVDSPSGVEGYLVAVQARARGTEPAPPDEATLIYFDREVVTPLVRRVIPTISSDNSAEAQTVLAGVNQAALAVGYQITHLQQQAGGPSWIVLAPLARGWGSYVFRLEVPPGPFIVQAPRAGVETGTREFALALFDQLQAQALLMAEPPATGSDPVDLLDNARPATLFDLVAQVVLRESGDSPALVVQARGVAADTLRARPEADVVVAFDLVTTDVAAETTLPLGQRLLDVLRDTGAKVLVAAGQPETAGLEIGWVRQARYLDAVQDVRFAVAWLMPAYRASFADRSLVMAETALFAALGIATIEDTPAALLARGPLADGSTLPAGLIAAVSGFQERQDSVLLRQAQIGFPGFDLQRLFDPQSRQSFVVIRRAGGETVALARMAVGTAGLRLSTPAAAPDPAQIAAFVQTRAAWLILEGAP